MPPPSPPTFVRNLSGGSASSLGAAGAAGGGGWFGAPGAAVGGGGSSSSSNRYTEWGRPSTGAAAGAAPRSAPPPTMGLAMIDEHDIAMGELIGQGSYGKVYRATWRASDVAVKELGSQLVDDARTELDVMARVGNHPHVVSLIGLLKRRDGRLAIVTQFVSGGNLRDVLRLRRVDHIDFVRMAMEAAAGVVHLHKQGVIHRDLACRNILVDRLLSVRVADFGYARVVARPDESAVTEAHVGPVRWLSPESLARGEYSERSDAWMFGVCLYEMVTHGAQPYAGCTMAVAASKVLSGATLQYALPVECDSALRALMRDCWQYEPRRRPSFVDIHGRLKAHLARLLDGARTGV